jgi:hypothetical protein
MSGCDARAAAIDGRIRSRAECGWPRLFGTLPKSEFEHVADAIVIRVETVLLGALESGRKPLRRPVPIGLSFELDPEALAVQRFRAPFQALVAESARWVARHVERFLEDRRIFLPREEWRDD